MTAIAIDDLRAFGVEELNTDTSEQIDGGDIGWGELAAGFVLNVLYGVMSDPGGAAKAFMEGFNATAS